MCLTYYRCIRDEVWRVELGVDDGDAKETRFNFDDRRPLECMRENFRDKSCTEHLILHTVSNYLDQSIISGGNMESLETKACGVWGKEDCVQELTCPEFGSRKSGTKYPMGSSFEAPRLLKGYVVQFTGKLKLSRNSLGFLE